MCVRVQCQCPVACGQSQGPTPTNQHTDQCQHMQGPKPDIDAPPTQSGHRCAAKSSTVLATDGVGRARMISATRFASAPERMGGGDGGWGGRDLVGLEGELAGGGEDEGLDLPEGEVHPLQRPDRERPRLACERRGGRGGWHGRGWV